VDDDGLGDEQRKAGARVPRVAVKISDAIRVARNALDRVGLSNVGGHAASVAFAPDTTFVRPAPPTPASAAG
jgi:hypothetical protein